MTPQKKYKEFINTGKWTIAELDALLAEASMIKDAGPRIDFILRRFLGLAYKESTLVGAALSQ